MTSSFQWFLTRTSGSQRMTSEFAFENFRFLFNRNHIQKVMIQLFWFSSYMKFDRGVLKHRWSSAHGSSARGTSASSDLKTLVLLRRVSGARGRQEHARKQNTKTILFLMPNKKLFLHGQSRGRKPRARRGGSFAALARSIDHT